MDVSDDNDSAPLAFRTNEAVALFSGTRNDPNRRVMALGKIKDDQPKVIIVYLTLYSCIQRRLCTCHIIFVNLTLILHI